MSTTAHTAQFGILNARNGKQMGRTGVTATGDGTIGLTGTDDNVAAPGPPGASVASSGTIVGGSVADTTADAESAVPGKSTEEKDAGTAGEVLMRSLGGSVAGRAVVDLWQRLERMVGFPAAKVSTCMRWIHHNHLLLCL